MKFLSTFIAKYATIIAALLLPLMVFVPKIIAGGAQTNQEAMILNLVRIKVDLTIIRSATLFLLLFNLFLVYVLFKQWFGARRAGLATLLVSCIPLVLLAQFSIIHLTMVLTPVLIAFVAFDKAGRSDSAALWYALAGFATTAAWVQEPVGVTLLLFICTLLLMAVKPRYIKHIVRQSTLVLIILVVMVAGITAASMQYHFGFQEYIVNQLKTTAHLMIIPKLLLDGPTSYRFGLPGVLIIPLAVLLLAGFGAVDLVAHRKRPRNVFILVLPVLLMITALAFTGITALLLVSVGLFCVAAWAAGGIEYLYGSWKQLFPHNKLANRTATVFLGLMMASIVFYSYWYIAKGWYGSPQRTIDSTESWDGTL